MDISRSDFPPSPLPAALQASFPGTIGFCTSAMATKLPAPHGSALGQAVPGHFAAVR